MDMKRSAIPLTLLLFFLFVAQVQSMQQTMTIVPSHGKLNSATNEVEDESRALWWGVVSGSTCWHASFVEQPQIQLIARAGATSIRIMLDKYDWDKNNIFSGKPYKDYIKLLVQSGHNEGIKVLLDMCRDSTNGEDFDTSRTKKVEVINSPSDWIRWGTEIISYCKPDAIGIMNEPRGDDMTFDHYYKNFVLPSIATYKASAEASGISDFKIFVMGFPFSDPHLFTGAYAIPDEDVIIDYHCYYAPVAAMDSLFSPVQPPRSVGTTLFDNMCTAFYNGDVTGGTNMLYDYLDWQLTGLNLSQVNLAEVGVFRLTEYDPDNDPTTPNYPSYLWTGDPSAQNPAWYRGWQDFMNAIYDYAVVRALHGLHQYQLAGNIYTILSGSDCTTLTPYGQVWKDGLPT
jgi:hypothetical protein